MGAMTNIQNLLGKPLHHGGHNHDVAAITNAAADGVTALSQLNWASKVPTLVRVPKPTSVRKADQAEMEAHQFEVAVGQGVRVLRAEARKQQANAKLARAHRQYLGDTAEAHLQMSAANTRLAGRLQGCRVAQAELGHGLERRIATADQQVAQIAAKYGAIG
jgi:hypothetical protein